MSKTNRKTIFLRQMKLQMTKMEKRRKRKPKKVELGKCSKLIDTISLTNS